MGDVIGDIIAAFLFAVLSGMGVGGGGFFVIYLTLIQKVPQASAQAANLVFFLFAAAASLIVQIRMGLIGLKRFIILAVPGGVMAYVGSLAASACEEQLLRSMFGVLLIFSGAVSLFAVLKKQKKER